MQLNNSNTQNTHSQKLSGTRRCYLYGLFQFNKWIVGKKIQHTSTEQISNNAFLQKQTTVKIKHVGHFLELYQQDTSKKSNFVVLIKKYLILVQSTKSRSVVDNSLYSIRSFFQENDTDITFRFKNKSHAKSNNHIMTLNDFYRMLSYDKIQPIEQAVFLCKFQRGLDNSTFTDRFNFEVWSQLVNYFGTKKYNIWDLSLCPVPIKLVRVKTNYLHTGFLDVDAIKAIQTYLNYIPHQTQVSNCYRCYCYSCRLDNNSTNIALFVDRSGTPISSNWIGRRFKKLYDSISTQNKYTSHELRDLLKSILLDSGCRRDVADHVIGHVPKDSYEKQMLLYPLSLRTEYSKCAHRINIISNSAVFLNVPKKNYNSCYENSIIDKFTKSIQRIDKIMCQTQEHEQELKSLKSVMVYLQKHYAS